MAKRDGRFDMGGYDSKRFRGPDRGPDRDRDSRSGGDGRSGGDQNLLSAVSQLLVAATGGAGSHQKNSLASLLTSALSEHSQGGDSRDRGSSRRSSSSYGRRSEDRSRARSRDRGRDRGRDRRRYDSLSVPVSCVGWLKGRQGAMIRDIEARSGAEVIIDQSDRDSPFCTVDFHGDEEEKRKAYGFVVAETCKAADQQNSGFTYADVGGTKWVYAIDTQYIGWVKGPRGKVIQDITARSNTRVDVDQSDPRSGTAIINVYGTYSDVAYAQELLSSELSKVNPDVAAAMKSLPVPNPTGHRIRQDTGHGQYTLQIPVSCVGWLKGKQGAMIREIENKSGASVEIDQTNKDQGFVHVVIRGKEDAQKTAHGLVTAEVIKVSEQSGQNFDSEPLGTKVAIDIDAKHIGWIKGPRGKVVQDITLRSGTRIDVEQPMGSDRAIVKVYGTREGVQHGKELIAHELSKVCPETSEVVRTWPVPGCPPTSAAHHGAFGGNGGSPNGGETHESLTIPASYVGWIKGKQGAVIREIEAKSNATVVIDQTNKELGHVQVNFRGGPEERRKAFGFVFAEVVKMSDQGGADAELFDCSGIGTKSEVVLDSQYIGWVKGPKGKVIQDISLKSTTRIDMDQSNESFAVVKIYGTYAGIEAAKEGIAQELSKVSAEAASEITGRSYDAPGGFSQEQPVWPMTSRSQMGSTGSAPGPVDLSSIASNLHAAFTAPSVKSYIGVDPTLQSQQAAAKNLIDSFLHELAGVAPGIVRGGPSGLTEM